MRSNSTATVAYPYYQPNLYHLSQLSSVRFIQKDASHSKATIGEKKRWETLSWMLETGFKVGVGSKAGQLACVYFDSFCAKWTGVVVEFLSAVALTTLMIATKLEGTALLTPDWVSKHSGSLLSPANIIDLESLILTILDWDLDLPTAAEISRLLLTFSAPDYDFSEVIETSDCYASVCYSLKSLISYGAEAIALASICCVFEQRGQTNFRDQWMEKVTAQTTVSRETVKELSGRIRKRLQSMYGSDEETDCGILVCEKGE